MSRSSLYLQLHTHNRPTVKPCNLAHLLINLEKRVVSSNIHNFNSYPKAKNYKSPTEFHESQQLSYNRKYPEYDVMEYTKSLAIKM